MNKIRKIFLLVLVLAYAGQSLAAGIFPCSAMAPVDAALEHAAMEHAGHTMPAGTEAEAAPMADDCCDAGLCSMSHCQSAAALPLGHPGSGAQYVAFYPRLADVSAVIQPIESLYRPPISR